MLNDSEKIIAEQSRFNKQNRPKFGLSSVAIVTHTFATGQAQEFRDYLIEHGHATAFIGLPLYPHNPSRRAEARFFNGGNILKEFLSLPSFGPLLLRLVFDLVFTLFAFIRFRRRFDIFYGANAFNALIGVVLKRTGLVRKVVFNTVDYSPRRYNNSALNALYHWADRMACYKSDQVWNLSPNMQDGRVDNGLDLHRSAPQIEVPIGCRFKGIDRFPLEKIARHTVVYMGHLVEEQGVDLLLNAWPLVIKLVPDAKLEIIGSGFLLTSLKEKAENELPKGGVIFHGFVDSHRDVEKMLARCAIGVAPYPPDPQGFKQYADPGKIKHYMACGLPVITTNVTPAAAKIQEFRSGKVVDYDATALGNAIAELLLDNTTYAQMRENAISFASNHEWSQIFERALNGLN